MTRTDVDNLFELLRIYFPHAKRVDDKKLRTAWLLLLSPYSPDTVREAVVDELRNSTNFPDAQKIAVRCQAAEPTVKEKPDVHQSNPYFDTAWAAPYIRKLAASVSEHDADKLHAAGLQTWTEAENAGMSFPDWNRAYRRIFPAVKGTVHGGEQAVGA